MTAAVLDGATLLKVNRDGGGAAHRRGPTRPTAAERLVEMGAAAGGGDARARRRAAARRGLADAPGVPADAVDTTGAGDVVTGVLVAALATNGFSAEAAAAALPAAVAAAARATEGWGAIDSLPDDDRDRVRTTLPARRTRRASACAPSATALRAYYGRPRNEPHHAPLDELVLTVLSQNTNDRNRDVAYVRLRARFPDWAAVAHAPVAEIEEAIRPGGISKVKSRRIKAMLGAIEAETGGLDLGFLAEAPREQAIEFLERLPGVGRKTAACVLLFSFDRPEMPVDTHVYRVASRLGLIRPRASVRGGPRRAARRDRPGRRLRAAREPDPPRPPDLHRARNPACAECPLLELCPYGKRATGRVADERRGASCGCGSAPRAAERDRRRAGRRAAGAGHRAARGRQGQRRRPQADRARACGSASTRVEVVRGGRLAGQGRCGSTASTRGPACERVLRPLEARFQTFGDQNICHTRT